VSTASGGSLAHTAQRVDGAWYVTGSDRSELQWIDIDEMLKLRFEDTDTGTPRYWNKAGATILLYPRPSAAGTLTVRSQTPPAVPATAGATVNWPDEHFDVLLYAVLMGAAARQRDFAARDRYKSDYNDALLAMFRSQQEGQQQQTTLEVESVDGFGELFR
jgi:hypothetical protein